MSWCSRTMWVFGLRVCCATSEQQFLLVFDDTTRSQSIYTDFRTHCNRGVYVALINVAVICARSIVYVSKYWQNMGAAIKCVSFFIWAAIPVTFRLHYLSVLNIGKLIPSYVEIQKFSFLHLSVCVWTSLDGTFRHTSEQRLYRQRFRCIFCVCVLLVLRFAENVCACVCFASPERVSWKQVGCVVASPLLSIKCVRVSSTFGFNSSQLSKS